MKNFEMKRFGNVLKWDFTTGRGFLLGGGVGMVLGYLFIFFVAHLGLRHMLESAQVDVNDYIHTVVRQAAGLSVLAFVVYTMVSTSMVFNREQRKAGRIVTLTLPASNAEKFLSRWLYMMLVSVVFGLVAFFVADALHMGFCRLLGYPIQSGIRSFYEHASLFPNVPVARAQKFAMVATFLALQSLFLLGGLFYRHYQAIATGITLLVGISVFEWLTTPGRSTDVAVYTTDEMLHYWHQQTAFYLAVAVGLTWLAYRLFCRWPIVTKKFMNL